MFQCSEFPLFKDCFFKKLHFYDNKRAFKTTYALLLVVCLFTVWLNEVNAQNIAVDINYVTGKFDPAQHPDFIEIDKKYARTVESSKKMYLRKETYAQLQRMFDAAAKDKIILNVLSATRNFDYQKNIWENKWHAFKNQPNNTARSKKILEYSAMPGASRHHWGTDIDLVAMTNAYFEHGEGLKIYNWLQLHAAPYGFCQPYTAYRKTGYNEEKWHWSYLPLAKTFQSYTETHLKDSDFKGFLGSNTALELQIVKNYVSGVNLECQ